MVTDRELETRRDPVLRSAAKNDEAWWLRVRNDPETRKQSFQSGEIDPKTHGKWFAAKLADPAERLYVLEENGEQLAQLRLTAEHPLAAEDTARDPDRLTSESSALCVEISYAVAPEARGHGIGKQLIRMAVGKAAEAFPGQRVILTASVKEGNTASRRIFRDAGFSETSSDDGSGAVILRREL